MGAMENPEDLRQRVRQEKARSERAIRASARLGPRVQATLARSRALHAWIVSHRVLARFRL